MYISFEYAKIKRNSKEKKNNHDYFQKQVFESFEKFILTTNH
jgi:hypothetical protein